ncbi:MAG TPA: MXAN_2562 family outer membrane beta-barrel protein [Myxococcota bacterium]|nr:MXAN_2562 family outer membrane beta-barrel protein [Myxococcota bacterium]
MNTRLISSILMCAFFAGLVPLSAVAEETGVYSVESPRRFILEARFGTFQPAVDSDFGNATPFEDVFGDGMFLMTQLEFEYEIWNKVGIIAVGITAGYSRMAGSGINPSDGTAATDGTAMNVMPLSAQLVYRFDYLAQRYNVPLVPHVKAGLDYWIWWIEDGVGDVAVVNDGGNPKKGYGGTWGGHVGLGIGFLLDFIAPRMAQTFDVDVGVNNSYIFFEYNWAWINDFGVGDRMNLSSGSFIGGLAFEF